MVNKQGEVRIQSYETGVLVWPELFTNDESSCEVSMVPTFGRDRPDIIDVPTEPVQHQDSKVVEDDEETEDEDDALATDDEETEDESKPVQMVKVIHDKTTKKGKAPVHVVVKKRVVVGLRMSYDLPLRSYSAKEVPWCATQQYTEPDWKGHAWGGY